jgi:type I restriction enzyme S subunit
VSFTFSELIARGSVIVNDGYRTKQPELASTGIPILRVAEIGNGFLAPKSEDRINESFRSAIGIKMSQPGDVLLTTKGTVGRRAIVPNAGAGFAYSPQVCFFRVTDKSIDPRWLYYWLEGREFWDQAIGVSTQTDMAPYISLRDLRAISINLPPISEQNAIAATLGALDDKIESNRRAIGMMEDLARSTFEQIFDLDQVDDGVALSELVNVNPQRMLRSGTPATYVGMSSLPEFSAEVFKWETREAGSGQRFVSRDVLMARITPCLENGKTAVVDMLKPDEVGWGSTEYVVLSPAGLFSTAWIYCLVRDERIRDFAIRSMTGTSGRQRFQADRFSQYRIVSPAAADLVRFNAVVEPLFTRMTQLRDESLKLTALRDALLPELLSGRIRVPAEGVAA